MSHHARRRSLMFIPLCAVTIACSSAETQATEALGTDGTRASTPSPPQSPDGRPNACALVTAAEMSVIIGTPVGSELADGTTATCRYKPAAMDTPLVEIGVDWGNGEIAMMSTGLLGRLEPGITDPLKGIGDQAIAIGPRLMIRAGEDLITLMLWGVDDYAASAKRIVDAMRPRMGPSGQPRRAASGEAGDSHTGAASKEARAAAEMAGQLLGGLLGAVNERQKRDSARADAGRGAQADDTRSNGRESAAASAPRAEEPTFRDATGVARHRIPLVKGLTIVRAVHQARRGDYEPIETIDELTADRISYTFTANLPEGDRIAVNRSDLRTDLQTARKYQPWFAEGDPEVFPGTTGFNVSAAVFNDITTKGETAFELLSSAGNPLLDMIAKLTGAGNDDAAWHRGTLKRVEPRAVAIPVLLNDQPVELPAIHMRGTLGGELYDFYILDEPENPIVLRAAGENTSQVVRIAFPIEADTPLEEKLEREERVELHGIYFDFGKATLRPESEPVLRDIGAALAKHPEWKIAIEGHTDNIGGDDYNLDLSRRRSAAVKAALVERHRIEADRLTPEGFGASRPKASNDTLSGRAQNRRVELVRQ